MSFSRELARQQIRYEIKKTKQPVFITVFSITLMCFIMKYLL
ncbi:hypothetical protein SPFL3102_00461 [Sporomusaceae bacterium FL31]|nr:hypothetical protein SPFL3101_01611 [Sporomusaceae bacterium FL31]GCE32665.1 hypothetical protein SPFL3102_00461 [Sporomusaceae bacterium]